MARAKTNTQNDTKRSVLFYLNYWNSKTIICVLLKQLTVSTGLCKVPYKDILSTIINENHVGIISIARALKRNT